MIARLLTGLVVSASLLVPCLHAQASNLEAVVVLGNSKLSQGDYGPAVVSAFQNNDNYANIKLLSPGQRITLKNSGNYYGQPRMAAFQSGSYRIGYDNRPYGRCRSGGPFNPANGAKIVWMKTYRYPNCRN